MQQRSTRRSCLCILCGVQAQALNVGWNIIAGCDPQACSSGVRGGLAYASYVEFKLRR